MYQIMCEGDNLSETNTTSVSKNKIKEKLIDLIKDKRPYKKRLCISSAVIFAFVFTFCFYGPLETVAFSSTSLLYTYKDVLGCLAIFSAIIFLIFTPLLALIKGKIFNYISSFIFASTVAGYLQGVFLNGNLGALTGDAIDWANYRTDFFVNILIWGFIFLAVWFILYLKRSMWRKSVIFVSIALVIMQIVPMIGIFAGAYQNISHIGEYFDEYQLSRKGMFNYSEKNNIFVFVLDRLDYDYIKEVQKHSPEFFNKLDGFTAYTNAISTYARTLPAYADLLNGYEGCAYDVPHDEYYTEGWENNNVNILAELKKLDYNVGLYTEMQNLFTDGLYAKNYVDNLEGTKPPIDYITMLQKLMELSAYRFSPLAFKSFFWADTNYYNLGVYREKNITYENQPYYIDESLYVEDFSNSTVDNKSNCFKMYHFMGPHDPHHLTEDGIKSENTTSAREQTMGSFAILYKIFDRMKELGIYEDATIIITADHGSAVSDYQPLKKATRIGMYLKPSGKSDTPLVYSNAQVSTKNLPSTIIKYAGGDYKAFGTPIDEVGTNDEIVRIYYKSEMGSTHSEEKVHKYEIRGDASKFENWKLVESFDVKYPFY